MFQKVFFASFVFLFAFSVLQVQAQEKKGNDIMMILDVSGSMSEVVGGKKKIDSAKEAIADFVNTLPNPSFMGLRAYGHGFPREQKNCTDTSLLAPVGKVEKTSFLQTVNALQPQGWTPIEYSLKQAVNDFPNKPDYGKSIILVSDGEESCGGDPCQAVKDLKAQGIDVEVHTVGFNVGDIAEKQLQCIANAGEGTYTSVTNASELSDSLGTLFTRASTGGYVSEADMTCPTSGKNFSTAQEIPEGTCSETIVDGESFWYKVPTKDGETSEITISIRIGEGTKATHEVSLVKYNDRRQEIKKASKNINYTTDGSKTFVLDIPSTSDVRDGIASEYFLEFSSEPFLPSDANTGEAVSFEIFHKKTVDPNAINQQVSTTKAVEVDTNENTAVVTNVSDDAYTPPTEAILLEKGLQQSVSMARWAMIIGGIFSIIFTIGIIWLIIYLVKKQKKGKIEHTQAPQASQTPPVNPSASQNQTSPPSQNLPENNTPKK